MPIHLAVWLGIVEGLTEYLPVSSTGHLVLASHLLGLNEDDPGTKAFEIVIQLGAILAVVVQYGSLLATRAKGLFTRDQASYRLLAALVVAFLPAAVVGLACRKAIQAHQLRPTPVCIALVVGGVFMIVVERSLGKKGHRTDRGLEDVTLRRALWIGLGQCFSLVPGTSRSMCTIVAAELSGLSAATAAEFSFLLALPTLGAATLYEGYKSSSALAAHVGTASLVTGLVVSFLVAWAVIASFLRYLKTRGLEPFGWYRVGVGLVALWLLAR
jgi:undecaprenyl-diphosphatase